MSLRTAAILLFAAAILSVFFSLIQGAVYFFELGVEIMTGVFLAYFLTALFTSVTWLLTGISYSKSDYTINSRKVVGGFMVTAGSGHILLLVYELSRILNKDQYDSDYFFNMIVYQLTDLFAGICLLILGVSILIINRSRIRIAVILVMINSGIQLLRIVYTAKTVYSDSMNLSMLNVVWVFSMIVEIMFLAAQFLWAYKIVKGTGRSDDSELIDEL